MSLVLECRGVWKIFGQRADKALAACRASALTRDDVRQQFQCELAVADVSFDVREGEVFCIMGLSGSGKSTLVRQINRLIEPTAGEILVQGTNILQKSAAELRRVRSEHIGMVFQNVAIFPHRNVRDNVAFGLEIRHVARERRNAVADEKLQLVQLSGWGDRFPHELSGGMQQRVGLARALANDPAILLMDEPFSALDPIIRRELQEEFTRLSSLMRKTTVFITHDLDEAIRVGHRIAIMKDGRFIQVGTPSEIIETPANDYVASFVRGVSRLSLLKAKSLLDHSEEAHAPAMTTVAFDTPLAAVLDHVAAGRDPIAVTDQTGGPQGVVTQKSLLLAIKNHT